MCLPFLNSTGGVGFPLTRWVRVDTATIDENDNQTLVVFRIVPRTTPPIGGRDATARLLDAYAHWQCAAPRPHLPTGGYRVRRDGDDDVLTALADGRALRRVAAPARVLAARAGSGAVLARLAPDESAAVEIVRSDGRVVPVAGARFALEQAAWLPDGTVVLTADGRLRVGVVDADDGRWQESRDVPRGRISVSTGGVLVRRSGTVLLCNFARGSTMELPPDTVTVVEYDGVRALVRRDAIEVGSPRRRVVPTRGTAIGAAAGRGGVAVLTVDRGRHRLTLVDRGGRVRDTRLVAAGTDICSVDALSVSDGEIHVRLDGVATPPQVFRYPWREDPRTAIPAAGEIVVARADDGADIDVLVTRPPDVRRPRPLLLDVYGGFGVAHVPHFEPTTAAWLDAGGAVALAQVRGGGERDERWRQDGRGLRKRRAVDDLACAARELVAVGASRPDCLVLTGGSLGGTVAAAAALRHPGIAAAVVTTAAPLDLARLSDNPLGSRWAGEFGDLHSEPAVAEHDPMSLARSRAAGAPPFLVLDMADDSRIDAAQGPRFAEVLRRAGVDAQHVRIAGAGHGPASPTALRDLGTRFLSYVARVLEEDT